MRYEKQPWVLEPFGRAIFADLTRHVDEVRRCFDWPSAQYHETDYNRWHWKNLPLLVDLHHREDFLKTAAKTFGEPVKPSYCFLSMYGSDGVCPAHTDRPPCKYTIDLLVSGGEEWPIYIADKPYRLRPGQAVCYSGTDQKHYRNRMDQDSKAHYANLVFFHFVPVDYSGNLT